MILCGRGHACVSGNGLQGFFQKNFAIKVIFFFMDQEMKRPMTEVEEKGYKVDIPRETIEEERIWNKRPDGIDIKMPTPETVDEFVILEFKDGR